VLEGNLKFAASAGSERRRGGIEYRTGLTKNHLMKGVVELDGEFKTKQSTVARVDDFARERGDFLIEKIFRLAHVDIFDLQVRSIRLLSRPEELLHAARSQMALV